MKNLKLTYHRNGDYFIPNLVLRNDEYKKIDNLIFFSKKYILM